MSVPALPDEVQLLTDGSWRMWALPAADGLFEHPGHRRYAQAYSQGQRAVPVQVTEDPDGPYWGWLRTGADQPSMIYSRKVAFNMCFPYGPHAEEQAGNGRIMRLRVEPFDSTVTS